MLACLSIAGCLNENPVEITDTLNQEPVANFQKNQATAPDLDTPRAKGSLCVRTENQVLPYPEILKVSVYWQGQPIVSDFWNGGGFYIDFPPGVVDYSDCPQWWIDRWGGPNVALAGAWLESFPNDQIFGNPHGDYRYICMVEWSEDTVVPDGAHIADIYIPLNKDIDLTGMETQWRVYIPGSGWGDFDGMEDCYSTIKFCPGTTPTCR
jgi:hypothetical protein